ncbi:MAG: glycosyltransferase family 4 protein [Caldilinea sp.]|nr:glycosyltransferase family 4 protein [Caldilinea sp.]
MTDKMRICMIFYDMQEFGGLEEYAATLAIGLRQQGHDVSALSTAWIPPDNQYLTRLRCNDISVTQLPKWLSLTLSDWKTKHKILVVLMRLLTPLTYLLAIGLFFVKRRTWRASVTSAYGWLHGLLLDHLIGPDRRKPFAQLLLEWQRLRWHPDVLHIQGYTSSLLFVIEWAHARRIPVVYEEHQTPDAQFDWWRDFQRSINKADRVLAVSEKSAEALRAVCGVTRPIVVRNPLLSDPFASGWSKPLQSTKHRPLFVTTVARLYITKGLSYLLEAIVLVRQKHPLTEFRVYGDGPMRAELLTYARQLGLDGDRIFVGSFTSREALSQIMSETDIFVMSSVLEGQPLGVVEAMAYGCPIVTTAVGGIAELISDGANGLLCSPRDPVCLARNVCLLIEDAALRARLTHEARQTYLHGSYQPSAVCSHIASVYRDAISERRSAISRASMVEQTTVSPER